MSVLYAASDMLLGVSVVVALTCNHAHLEIG